MRLLASPFGLTKFQIFFYETLIFADFLKKKCQRKRREQMGSTVFPLLFFPRGRIRTTRREKKNQNL
jgi:hypothetical protein